MQPLIINNLSQLETVAAIFIYPANFFCKRVGCKSNGSLTGILCDLCKNTNTKIQKMQIGRGVADCQVASPDGCSGIRHQQTVEWPQPAECRQVAQIHKYKLPCQNFSTNFKFTNTNTNNTNTNTIKLTVEPTGYVSDYLLFCGFSEFFFLEFFDKF